jgi:hypothetical protein
VNADRTSHIDEQALTREFIDQGQALELLPIGAGIKDKVV